VTHRDDDRASFAQPQRKNVVQPALLVSLHDVTPAHAARLARAEQLLSALGVREVAYLYVPDFHGRAPAHDDPAFAAWCRAARPFRVQWLLHGYYHLERREAGGSPSTPATWFARTFLTDGEGEFLSVCGRELQDRLASGIASLTATVGSAPEGFVPPAWLSNADLIPALERLGVRFTEDHFHLVDLRARRTVAAADEFPDGGGG
jgi:predicted deacetylase